MNLNGTLAADIDRLALESGIMDLKADLYLLDKLVEEVAGGSRIANPDAPDDTERGMLLIDERVAAPLVRLFCALRDDVRTVSEAFYGKGGTSRSGTCPLY